MCYEVNPPLHQLFGLGIRISKSKMSQNQDEGSENGENGENFDNILKGITGETQDRRQSWEALLNNPIDEELVCPENPPNLMTASQMYIIDCIRRVVDHVCRDGHLHFRVEFTTNQFGGNRWMAARCLRQRPSIVASYWNARALQKARKGEDHRKVLSMETTVFGIYDF